MLLLGVGRQKKGFIPNPNERTQRLVQWLSACAGGGGWDLALLASDPLSSRNTDPQAPSRQPGMLERDWTIMNIETDVFLEASKDRVPS